MPSSSQKQHNFMAAVKHNKKFAKKVDVPQSVAQDFLSADQGGTFDRQSVANALRRKKEY